MKGDLRARLSDALRQNMFGHPEWAMVANPDQLADVLLSLPGIAVVELPEPHEELWSVGDVADVEVNSEFCGRGVRLQNVGFDLVVTAGEAREFAAALLAAANAAEKPSETGEADV